MHISCYAPSSPTVECLTQSSFMSKFCGNPCVFPFKYKNLTHTSCTYADSDLPWCATMVDKDGEMVRNR